MSGRIGRAPSAVVEITETRKEYYLSRIAKIEWGERILQLLADLRAASFEPELDALLDELSKTASSGISHPDRNVRDNDNADTPAIRLREPLHGSEHYLIDGSGRRQIAVEAMGVEAGMPMAERGLELDDGTILSTWNWIAKPGSAEAERKTNDLEGQAEADWTPQGMKINTRGVAHLPEEIRGETFLPETAAWKLKADVKAEQIEDKTRSRVRGDGCVRGGRRIGISIR